MHACLLTPSSCAVGRRASGPYLLCHIIIHTMSHHHFCEGVGRPGPAPQSAWVKSADARRHAVHPAPIPQQRAPRRHTQRQTFGQGRHAAAATCDTAGPPAASAPRPPYLPARGSAARLAPRVLRLRPPFVTNYITTASHTTGTKKKNTKKKQENPVTNVQNKADARRDPPRGMRDADAGTRHTCKAYI